MYSNTPVTVKRPGVLCLEMENKRDRSVKQIGLLSTDHRLSSGEWNVDSPKIWRDIQEVDRDDATEKGWRISHSIY